MIGVTYRSVREPSTTASYEMYFHWIAWHNHDSMVRGLYSEVVVVNET